MKPRKIISSVFGSLKKQLPSPEILDDYVLVRVKSPLNPITVIAGTIEFAIAMR